MKSYIITKVVYEALHRWENADSIPEVSFLKHPHRHLFHITLHKEVSHDDRQIEFIVFKHQVQSYLEAKYSGDFGSQSCEMIAKELIQEFDCVCVEVLEDSENGAVVTK